MICRQSWIIGCRVDRIDLFRIFARVVESSSFTKAADTLGIPRSSVSAAVQELESRVGARLLARTTRRVSVTHDGAAFYERCVRLIADVEDAESLFVASAQLPSGKLRVDVPGRVGRLILAPALPAFLEQYPGLHIELGVSDRMVNLIEDSVDCALRIGGPPDAGLIVRDAGELPLVNVASRSYVERHGLPTRPEELDKHWTVAYASPSTGRVEPWEWVEHGLTRTASLQSRVTVNSAEGYIACCLAGLGLIQVPSYDVRQHVSSGEMVEVLPRHRAAPLPMRLLYPHRHHLSHRLQVFADWLEKLVRKELAG